MNRHEGNLCIYTNDQINCITSAHPYLATTEVYKKRVGIISVAGVADSLQSKQTEQAPALNFHVPIEKLEMYCSAARGNLEPILVQTHWAITAWASGVRCTLDRKKLSEQLLELAPRGFRFFLHTHLMWLTARKLLGLLVLRGWVCQAGFGSNHRLLGSIKQLLSAPANSAIELLSLRVVTVSEVGAASEVI